MGPGLVTTRRGDQLAVPASVAVYSGWGRKVPAPRPNCARCALPMAFDGSYPRFVREAGKLYMIFVRRARCGGCGAGEPSLPDFVLARRRDSTAAVGAAVPAPAGVGLPEGSASLYQGVPGRTVRSWRQRFSQLAGELSALFEALAAERSAPAHGAGPPSHHAVVATRRFWQTARRRVGDVRPGHSPMSWSAAACWPPAWTCRGRGTLGSPAAHAHLNWGLAERHGTVAWRSAGFLSGLHPHRHCRNEHDLLGRRVCSAPLGQQLRERDRSALPKRHHAKLPNRCHLNRSSPRFGGLE